MDGMEEMGGMGGVAWMEWVARPEERRACLQYEWFYASIAESLLRVSYSIS